MVVVSTEGGDHAVAVAEVTRLAGVVLDALALSQSELSVVLCDDAFIRGLNAVWRDSDEATDVLSFPQEEPDAPGVFEEVPEALGDVIISLETADRQARAAGHTPQVEWAVLLVHGVLHLVGYDHEDEDDAAKMRQAEVSLLTGLGVDANAALIARAG